MSFLGHPLPPNFELGYELEPLKPARVRPILGLTVLSFYDSSIMDESSGEVRRSGG